MATNKIYASSQRLHRDRSLSEITVPTTAPTSIQPGVPVVFGDGSAVSLTASGNATVTQTTGLPEGINSINYDNGGVGNLASPASASFAFDGSWDFAVTGATTSTGNGVKVYITPTGTLTLTEGTNTLFGTTDYPNQTYTKVAGRAVVKIGA